jgi:GTPase SAR1 family protein
MYISYRALGDNSDLENREVFFKLSRFADVKAAIASRFNFELLEKRTLNCNADFREHLDKHIEDAFNPDDEVDVQSRREKVQAMEILAKYRTSILVGPAGSGKTTLLKAFCDIQEIKEKGVVLLAPTGKARVNMSPDAMTIAQFLIKSGRYNSETGQYTINPDGKRETCGTLIIDEASMLTEEQLAAVLDAVIYERLILVGDYRQLPPIGAGRPFYDIANELKPRGIAFAELTNVSRQKNKQGKPRLDVKLSRMFGETHKTDYEGLYELLTEISKNEADEIRLIRWDTGEELRKTLLNAVAEHLALDKSDLIGSFEVKALGKEQTDRGKYYNHNYSEKLIEKWQILSPVNGHTFGTKEINKNIQYEFRRAEIENALNWKSNIPKPLGRDNFVYGDKVINLRNTAHKYTNPYKSDSLEYLANGEVGVIVGEVSRKKNKRDLKVFVSLSSQPGYAYSFFQSQFDEDKKAVFELAYCISVHKSQGSGFDTVFLVLPANNPMLSRELLYTALTRQKEKIIILHQGEFANFLKYSGGEYSETGWRLTDLFLMPDMQKLGTKAYDSRYVNITQKGEPVISKSEALIANILYSYEKQGLLTYSYESKLTLETGRTVRPDFTIEDVQTGRKFYWEHLGLLNTQDYKDKWALKREGYIREGVVPAETATLNDDVILIASEDSAGGGLDTQSVEQKIKDYILNY